MYWQDTDDAAIITKAIAARGEWRVDGTLIMRATGTFRQADELGMATQSISTQRK